MTVRIEDLNRAHPEYDAKRQDELVQLHRGGRYWEPRRWLPQREAESDDAYKERMSVATYVNDAGPLIAQTGDQLFAAPCELEGLVTEPERPVGEDGKPGDPPPLDPESQRWSDWLTDVDGRGTDWSGYVRACFDDAMESGASYTFVDMPQASDEQQRLPRGVQRDSGLLTPRLSRYSAKHAINWGEDEAGALAWVLLRETVTRTSFDAVSGSRGGRLTQWTYIGPDRLMRWQADADADDGADADLVLDRPLTRLPVVRMVLPEPLHAMARLLDPATVLLRARHGYDWAVYRTALSMLMIRTDANLDGLSGGVGWFVRLPYESASDWSAPPPHTAETARLRSEEARADLYRAMAAVFQSASDTGSAQQSGAAKAMDWQGREVQLAGYAALLLDYATAIGRMAVARGALIDDVPDVEATGLDGYQQLDIAEFFQHASMASDLRESSPTAVKAIARQQARHLFAAGSIPASERAAIDAEIEAYDPEAAAEAELERFARSTMGGRQREPRRPDVDEEQA